MAAIPMFGTRDLGPVTQAHVSYTRARASMITPIGVYKKQERKQIAKQILS